MRQLHNFGIRVDNISKPLSVTSKLLDKEIQQHNTDLRKPLLKKGESFYTKKLDDMHISRSDDGSSKTRCGRYCLGNNYADTKSQWVPTIGAQLRSIRPELNDIPEEQVFYKGGKDRDRCPECFGSRIYGDTPLYPAKNINAMNAKTTLTNFEREKINQAVTDRKSAKQVFRKQHIIQPLDKSERYSDDYRAELLTGLELNRRILRK